MDLDADFSTELEDFEVRKKGQYDRIWNVEKGGAVDALKVYGDVVYACSADNHIYAIECLTGRELWRFKGNGIFMNSYPVEHKNYVISGNFDGYVYALNKENGSLIWKFKTGGAINTAATIVKGIAYIGSRDGYEYAINADSGNLIWRFKTGEQILSKSLFSGGRMYFGSSDGYLYCLDASGKELWRFKTGDEVYNLNDFGLRGNVLLLSSFDNNIYALNAETGREIWRFHTGKYGNAFAPEFHGNDIYHRSRDGILYRLDLKGNEVWRFRAEKSIGWIIVKEDRIFAPSENGNVYCIDRRSGKEIWRFAAGYICFPIDEWKSRIFVGSWDCHLYCLDKDTGKKMWSFATSIQHQPKISEIKEEFEIIVRKTFSEEEIREEKEDRYSVNVSIPEIIESEYVHRSEYSSKGRYAK